MLSEFSKLNIRIYVPCESFCYWEFGLNFWDKMKSNQNVSACWFHPDFSLPVFFFSFCFIKSLFKRIWKSDTQFTEIHFFSIEFVCCSVGLLCVIDKIELLNIPLVCIVANHWILSVLWLYHWSLYDYYVLMRFRVEMKVCSQIEWNGCIETYLP